MKHSPPRQDAAQAVLITGASSGIGRTCGLALDARGFQVFATVRTEADAAVLRAEASGRLIPLLMDVTDAAAVTAAISRIAAEAGPAGLAGLINNAGATIAGPLEYQPLSDVRRLLEVNLLGPLALTQAALPLLRQGRGRIINISSVGGRLAMPFNGAYSATKFGVEAISDALRRELLPWGIRVAVIEPGLIATAMGDKLARDSAARLDAWPAGAHARYGRAFQSMVHHMAAHGRAGSSPTLVAEAVLHALTSPRPHTRYAVGRGAWRMTLLARILPDQVLDGILLRFFGLSRAAGDAASLEHGARPAA